MPNPESSQAWQLSEQAHHVWRRDERTGNYHRLRVAPLVDGGFDEVVDDPYTFDRACVLDGFPLRQQVALTLLRSRSLGERIERVGPDLPD